MKFSIGYQLPDQYDSTAEIVEDYREHISSVYFSSPGMASARSAIDSSDRNGMLEELKYIRDIGIPLVALYNANCYGDIAISPEMKNDIIKSTGEMVDTLGLSDVTTTSPFVAQVIKREFPEIKICASVNMWIGTEQAMKFLGDNFDAYYMQREYNRDFKRIEQLKNWCSQNGKQLKLLANSGCLYTCPFHTFHDNLVAHEKGVSERENAMGNYPSPCWNLMRSLNVNQAAATLLQESWIRPEDVKYYEPYFDEMKLATRMHSNPRRVVSAYVRGKFTGNLFDLTEPSYSIRFKDHILDATKIPSDWFSKTSNCSRSCDKCGYCSEVAKAALTDKLALEKMYMSE